MWQVRGRAQEVRRKTTWSCPALWLSGAVAIAALTGCGKGAGGPERVVVSGTVTYRGAPLSDGEIRFVPLPTCPVPTTAARIVDGKYEIEGSGGVPVGSHKIQIEAYRWLDSMRKSDASLPPDTSMRRPRQQYLPKKYNSSTELEITIEPGSSAITKDFELTD